MVLHKPLNKQTLSYPNVRTGEGKGDSKVHAEEGMSVSYQEKVEGKWSLSVAYG